MRGENPVKQRIAKREESTFGELLDTYIEEHATVHCVAATEIAAVFRLRPDDSRLRHRITINQDRTFGKLLKAGVVEPTKDE